MKKILLIANSDWNSFWFQRQEFAKRFAEEGNRVVYVNRSFQRFPKFSHLLKRVLPSKKRGTLKNSIPENVTVITPKWLPPIKWFNFINKRLAKYTAEKIKEAYGDFDNVYAITYLPTYPSLHLFEIINPKRTAYVNVHNYDDGIVLSDLLISERIMVKTVDVLFADSDYNRQRLRKISDGREVFTSPPGVHYENFKKAYRGDEVKKKEVIMFYGGIGNHLDFDIYVKLSKKYRVVFIGVISPELKRTIPDTIEVRDPVPNEKLPEVLREADILSILYKGGGFVNAKLPAKFFECVSTLKPLIVSGLQETERFPECVYQVNGNAEIADEIIQNLESEETEDRINAKKRLGKEYDWSNRFEKLKKDLFKASS